MAEKTLNVGLFKSIESWILLGLGRKEEARKSINITIQAAKRPYRVYNTTVSEFDPIFACMLLGERKNALELTREACGKNGNLGNVNERFAKDARAALRRLLEFDPRLRSWRDDAEVKDILSEPDSTR